MSIRTTLIVVDIGSIFPREDMPGVDLVIPDTSYLEHNKEKLRGYFITHGHEDHIGAVPYVLRNLPAPVYGTKLTLALCENKLKEHRLTGSVPLNVVEPGDAVTRGRIQGGIYPREPFDSPARARLRSIRRWA